MTSEEDLIVKFGPSANKTEVVSALKQLMKLYLLDAEELFIKWEQFSYHTKAKHSSNTFSEQILHDFKNYIQLQIEKKTSNSLSSINGPSSVTKKPKILRPTSNSPSIFNLGIPTTPTLKKRKLEANKTPSASSNFSTDVKDNISKLDSSPLNQMSSVYNTPDNEAVAPNKVENECDKCLLTLNVENVSSSEGMDFESDVRVKVTPFYDAIKYKFRTMRQSLLDSADVLDEQIDIFTEIIQQHYDIKSSDIQNPTIQQQSEIWTVGRIVSDSPTSEGLLNVESLAIETSRSTGIGRRIRLNFEMISDLSVFPGQIVAMKGKNANGEYFMVSEILKIPYLNFPASDIDTIEEAQLATSNQQMKVVLTSGPYTPSNAIDFSILKNFVERINDSIRPHILIMFGPFLDVTHPLISTGNIPNFPGLKQQPRTLDELFMKIIVPILKSINPKIQVILIPSTKDVASKHAAYPQDAFDRKLLNLPKNFKCFANPSTFQLNELFFGCSNNDIYKDLREITKGGNVFQRNRFDRVSEHILEQRRYYPVFPGGIKTRKLKNIDGKQVFEHLSGADLDVPYLGLTEFVGGIIPDVIIIPSELNYFARVVQNVTMINPGSFIKSNGTNGTYVQMSIESPDVENGKMSQIDEVFLHNLWKRSRIDILTA